MKLDVALLLVAAALPVSGQTNHWREFTKADGLPEDACMSVTIGARGNIFVCHPHENSIALLDGYKVTLIPAPGPNRSRVYEGVGSQLWSVEDGGLAVFDSVQWSAIAVPEIAEHFQAGFTNAIPLCPIRQGQVLVLLPERLLQVDARDPAHPLVQVIRRADQGKLGAFNALATAGDGGLWISGERGVAKIPGPLRALKPDSEWNELIPPSELQIQNFGVGQEDAAGNLTALAETAATHAPVLVRYAADRWMVRDLDVKNPRFAWHVFDKTWIATGNSLWELPDTGTNEVLNREISGREIFDAAEEPDGVFWLATSDGLFRHAPVIWHMPAAASLPPTGIPTGGQDGQINQILESIRKNPRNESEPRAGAVQNQRVHTGTTDFVPAEEIARDDWKSVWKAKNGDLWLGGTQGTAWRHGNEWRIFSSTNQFGPENVIGFTEAPDGRIYCATASVVWEFDGKNWSETQAGFDLINDLRCSRDGTLWVATAKNLWRLCRGAWIENGPEDGLPSGVSKLWEDQDGQIWANTSGGWRVFNPEADTDPPRTFLRESPGDGRGIYEGALVTFTFTGRDKWDETAPDRLLFSWRLDENEWSQFQSPEDVSFYDLAVGKHVFQVRTMDRAGNLEPKPAQLELTVILPWYRQPQLVLILATALVVATFFAGLAFNRHRKLQRSYAEVERQIAERTRELEMANRELLNSQKMNALGTLAAGIAHDFNNILSIIKGSAQLIEENTGNPHKIKTRLDRIKTVVQQGAEIVDAMLGFSRGSDSPAAPCDLNAVIADTIKLLGDRFLREAEVRFERGGALPEISVPKDFVQQILLNFIFNAAEAQVDRKQITLTARTARKLKLPPELVLKPAPAPAYVLISVQDHGGGIAPEIKSRIFEPFFTTKALSTKRGTGLGLSMVYELAKKMEAGLAVESTVGEGSTFVLILPVRSASDVPGL